MSLEVEVLATVSGVLRWAELARRLPGHSLYELVKGHLRPVASDEELSTPRVYCVDSTSVTVVPMLNVGNYDEAEYLDDYGDNLSSEDKADIARRWRAAGRWYGIDARMADGALMIAVATAIADATRGYVTPLNDYLDLGEGVYRPEDFSQARVRPRP